MRASERWAQAKVVGFFISAIVTGFVVVFALPFVKSYFDKIPGIGTFTSNRFVQLLIVGAIVMLSMGIASQIVRRVARVKV